MRVLPRFVYRAPLLPFGRRGPNKKPDKTARTDADALAAEELARVPTAARARYERRARFRPTPHGLWAGVGVGSIGERTRARTGPLRAERTVPYERLWRWARERLDPEAARLRSAPSLVRDDTVALWIAFGDDDQALQRAADIDDTLARVLDRTVEWVAWRTLADDAAVDDDFLALLVDDGLLVHDGAPPLVGAAPLSWMAARHDEWRNPPADELMQSVLVHEGDVTLSRAAVERAAALAPLLFRVQEALAPPVAERRLDQTVEDALTAVEEVFGEGAYDLDALALGRYGSPLDGDGHSAGDRHGTADGHGAGDGDSAGRNRAVGTARPQHAPVVRVIVDAIVRALATGADEAPLDAAALDAAAPDLQQPPTFELMLAPCTSQRGGRPGDGWLVGLHAPAGASWGRFAHAVGAPLVDAMAPLAALPGTADVDFAPSLRLADLCAHPPLRATTLALSSWPEPSGRSVLTAATLAVGFDALQTKAGQPVRPSPLWRVRSTTAPRGFARLLTGWSMMRQHAPWALTLGALADLPYVPRLVLDGFVVAPASWRVPPLPDRAALRRWRQSLGVPDAVQVGEGDELLYVDLDARDALDDVRGAARAYEVWPPLDRLVDEGGRRLEAIVAVVADDEPPPMSARVPPPTPAPGWQTWKLFGAADRAERVLQGVIAPAIAEGRRAGEVAGWFFLRYVDGPGRRDHLRLRVRGASPQSFAGRLATALAPARAAGDVVAVERTDYFRELARYGADAIEAVEAVFESDSELVLALADHPDGEADPLELLVASYDALAAGAGLDGEARHALARRRREAYGIGRDDALAAQYRARQQPLRARLASPSAPFVEHAARVTAALGSLPIGRREALLPPLLHLAAVRMVGIEPAHEAAAFYLWERTRESLARHRER